MKSEDEITDEELAAMQARADAATEAPWQAWVEGRDGDSGSSFIMTGGEDLYLSSEDYRGGGGHAAADHDFIAHARQDVPRLVAEVRRLRLLLRGARSE